MCTNLACNFYEERVKIYKGLPLINLNLVSTELAPKGETPSVGGGQ
jgi:hypothetical protein